MWRILQSAGNDKIASHPIIRQIVAEQEAARLREATLTRLIEHVSAQMKTIIDQNDVFVRAIHASGLLDGHASE